MNRQTQSLLVLMLAPFCDTDAVASSAPSRSAQVDGLNLRTHHRSHTGTSQSRTLIPDPQQVSLDLSYMMKRDP